MTNKITISIFFAMVSIHGLESSYAFQMHRQSATPSKIFAETHPFREIDIDLDLAEDCATNFGKYSVDEIEHYRDEVHAHRVQNVAFGEDMNSPDIMKERFLEDELTLQLGSLRNEMPKSYLFPDEETFDSDINTDMGFDGLLTELVPMDFPPLQDTDASSQQVVESKKSVVWEELVREGVLESVSICAFVGFVILSPGFI